MYLIILQAKPKKTYLRFERKRRTKEVTDNS